jgi:hypothetical protein
MGQSDKHFELAINISIEALKSLLFVNAGAAASLIALTDKPPAGPNYGISIVLFGAGAMWSWIAAPQRPTSLTLAQVSIFMMVRQAKCSPGLHPKGTTRIGESFFRFLRAFRFS